MKLLDLFPTSDALFKAMHPPRWKNLDEFNDVVSHKKLIETQNAEVLKAFDRCYSECGPPDHRILHKAFFCALDTAIRTVTDDESLRALAEHTEWFRSLKGHNAQRKK